RSGASLGRPVGVAREAGGEPQGRGSPGCLVGRLGRVHAQSCIRTHGPGVGAAVCSQHQLGLVAGQQVAPPGLGASLQRMHPLRLQAPAAGFPAQRRHPGHWRRDLMGVFQLKAVIQQSVRVLVPQRGSRPPVPSQCLHVLSAQNKHSKRVMCPVLGLESPATVPTRVRDGRTRRGTLARREVRVSRNEECHGPACGVPSQQVPEQDQSVPARVWHHVAQGHLRELREPEVHGCRQLVALGPLPLQPQRAQGRSTAHLVWGSEHGADAEDLVHLAASGEERLERVQLCQDASHRPQVDRANKRQPDQLFPTCPGSVQHPPSCGDVVRVRRLGAYLPGETEVCNLDQLGPRAEQVLGLDVPVEEAMFVHEGQALKDLLQDAADHGLRKRLFPAACKRLVEVLAHVLKNKVEGVVFPDDLLELHQVGMAQLLQRLHTTPSGRTRVHAFVPGVVLLLHPTGVPLDGHLLSRVEGPCQHNVAEGAVSQLMQQLVALHGWRVPLHAGNTVQSSPLDGHFLARVEALAEYDRAVRAISEGAQGHIAVHPTDGVAAVSPSSLHRRAPCSL
ncbi:unnamed protein product, partial [Ixodes hexagonus]